MYTLIYLQDNSIPPWQVYSWQAAIVTGLVVAIVALVQAIANLMQRKREMRWKQAELARKFLDDVYSFPLSHNALIMIDEDIESFQLDNGDKIDVSSEDVEEALTTPVVDPSDKAKYIRRCFDELFYHMERMEHSIQIKLIRWEDIQGPAEYYAERMALHKKRVAGYIQFIKYYEAGKLLTRFKSWRDASS